MNKRRLLAINLSILMIFSLISWNGITVKADSQEELNVASGKYNIDEELMEKGAPQIQELSEEDNLVVANIDELCSEHNYDNNMNKTWTYTVENAAELKVVFSDFSSLESEDYLYVLDKDGNEVEKGTGTSYAGKTVEVMGDTVKIKLVTDSSGTDWGFAIDNIIKMSSISVTKLPDVTEYEIGNKLDYTGMKVTGTFDDGATKDIDRYVIGEIDKSVEGTQSVEVLYNGLSTSFDVEIVKHDIEQLVIKSNPAKMEYLIGDEFNITGLEIEGLDSEGKAYIINDGYTLSGFDSSDLGTKEIIVTYGELQASFEVTVGYAFSYEISNGTVRITGLRDQAAKVVTIPDEVEGLNVSSVKASAFLNNTIIEQVILPETVTSIGSSAFSGCSGLQSINIPTGVTKIESETFKNCSELTKIVIPDGVTDIGYLAFYDCKKLEELTMPCSAKISTWGEFTLTPVSSYTDSYSYYEKQGNELYYYYSGSFTGCRSIKKVTLSRGTGVMVDYTNKKDSTNTTNTTNSGYYKVMPWHESEVEIVVLEDGIENIGSYSFYNQTELKQINIVNTVTKIGEYAFYECKQLKFNGLPSALKIIEICAFRGCAGILSIEVPDGITTIPSSLFAGCVNLEKVTLPETVTSIGPSAFSGCSALQSINIPTGVTRIESETFKNCSELTKIVIPDGVTNIGYYAFYDCKKLEELTMPCSAKISTWGEFTLTPVSSYTDSYSYYEKQGNGLYYYYSGSFTGCRSVKKVTLSRGTDVMVDYTNKRDSTNTTNSGYYKVMPWYESEVETVVLEDGIENIGSYSFYDQTRLERVNIVPTVTKIGEDAFYGCKGLVSIEIPDSVEKIEKTAFSNKNMIIYTNEDTVAAQYALDNGFTYYSTKNIVLDNSSLILYKGETERLKATVIMLNDKENTKADVDWKSSNTEVIAINDGKVSVMGPGKATITASFQGKEAVCDVTVYYKLESLSFTKTQEKVYVNDSKELEIQYNPSNTTDNKKVTWETSDESIIVVDQNGIVTGVSKGTATVTATSVLGMVATIDVTVLVPTERIELDDAIEIERGETKQLTKTVEPITTTDSFTWESKDESVVTVDDSGVIKAVGIGAAVVKVTAESGISAECIVNVKAKATAISCSVEEVTMYEKDSQLLMVDLLPVDTTDKVSWRSKDSNIATIDEKGLLTGVKAGNTEVLAVTDSGLSVVVQVKVLTAYHITEIALSNNDIIIERDAGKDISFSIVPSNYTDIISWESADESIATVVNGRVQGVSIGETKITVKGSNGVSAECLVHVVVSAESIELNVSEKLLNVGDEIDLVASFLPIDATDTCVFTSSDSNVASVNPDGKVIAKSLGTCTITATTTSGKQAKCEIHVVEKKHIDSSEELKKISDVTGSHKCVLDSDVFLGTSSININKSAQIEIDLNGHKILGKETIIVNNGTLTILDMSDSRQGEITAIAASSSASDPCVVENNGKLYINGGRLSAKAESGTMDLALHYAYAIINKGYFEMAGGDVYACTNANVIQKGALYAYSVVNVDTGDIKITGGNITAEAANSTMNSNAESKNYVAGIYHNSSGDIELNGGNITANIMQNSTYTKVTNFCSAVWNNSIGTVKIDGAKLYSSNEGAYSPGNGYISGVVGQGSGILHFLSGEIYVEGKDYPGYGINNVNGLIKNIGEKENNVRDKVKIVSHSNVLGSGIVDFAKLGFFIYCGDVEGTHVAINSNGTVVVGNEKQKINNQMVKLSVSPAGFVFAGDNNYVYAGEFLGRFGDVSVKLLKGYEFSDKNYEEHRMRYVTLTNYSITYHLNGGTNDSGNKTGYTILDDKFELKIPTKNGYTFAGWYLDKTLTEAVTFVDTSKHENFDLYAKWMKNGKDDKFTDSPIQGEQIIDKKTNAKYKVINLSNGEAEVQYVAPITKTASSITISDSIKLETGETFIVTSIADNAFKGNKKLTKVKIGKNVLQIGNNAFSGCSKLKQITMGSNVKIIGNNAFYKCVTLSKIIIPVKVIKIGKKAFYGCKKLKLITIKTSKLSNTRVGNNAFKGIYPKAKVKVPKKKLKSYKALLKKKGAGNGIVVKK